MRAHLAQAVLGIRAHWAPLQIHRHARGLSRVLQREGLLLLKSATSVDGVTNRVTSLEQLHQERDVHSIKQPGGRKALSGTAGPSMLAAICLLSVPVLELEAAHGQHKGSTLALVLLK